MTIAFSCPGCGKQFKVSDNMAGRKAKCSACATVMLVPAAEQGVASAPTRQPPPPPQDYGPDEPVPERGKRGKKKKKSRTPLLLALLAALLGTCVCCGGVGGFVGLGYFGVWDPLGLSGGLGSEARYLPDHCEFVAVINMEQILDSDAYNTLKKEVPGAKEDNFSNDVPIPITNVTRVVIGGGGNMLSGATPEGMVLVVKTKKDIALADLQKGGAPDAAKTITAKGYTIYTKGTQAYCLIDGRTVLFSPKGDTIRKVLERDSKPEFSDNLRSAMRQANFGKSVSFAVDLRGIKPTGLGRMGGPPGAGNPFAGLEEIGQKSQAVGGYVHLGKDIDMDCTLLCADDKAAEDVKKLADGFKTLISKMNQLPAEGRELLEAIQIKSSGSKVTFSATYKTATIVRLMKLGKKGGFPFGQAKPVRRDAVARADLPIGNPADLSDRSWAYLAWRRGLSAVRTASAVG